MKQNPIKTLRSALEALLEGATFQYDAGETRKLVRQGQKALRTTTPIVAHEHAAGIFRYDPTSSSWVPVLESQAIDGEGNLRPGYTYLFEHPPELLPH
jgi:hypothetical protein